MVAGRPCAAVVAAKHPAETCPHKRPSTMRMLLQVLGTPSERTLAAPSGAQHRGRALRPPCFPGR